MALTDCVAARWWLSAAAMICVCGLAEAQESKSATVPVEAAKVTAAPLSEQVTAIGTLLSDEAVTVSSALDTSTEPATVEKV